MNEHLSKDKLDFLRKLVKEGTLVTPGSIKQEDFRMSLYTDDGVVTEQLEPAAVKFLLNASKVINMLLDDIDIYQLEKPQAEPEDSTSDLQKQIDELRIMCKSNTQNIIKLTKNSQGLREFI